MGSRRVEAVELLKAVLTVVAVAVIVLASRFMFPTVFEKLTFPILLSLLATGIATSLAAIALVVAQRSVVMHDDQPGLNAFIANISGGRRYLAICMNSVSLFAIGMPVVALAAIVFAAQDGDVLGVPSLEFATMAYLTWFCLLMLVVIRLEYAFVNGLSKTIEI